jgi:oligosaccharide repeat unit polymerase
MEAYNPWPLTQPPSAQKAPNRVYPPPAPVAAGTACLVVSIAVAYSLYPAETTSTEMASAAANAVAMGFLGSLFFDSRKGLRNLLRTDILCLVGIYALTLAEFLFPQEGFDAMSTPEETTLALNIVLVGMAAMTLGRHLIKPKPMRSPWLNLIEISNSTLFRVYVTCAFLGFLYMLMSVDFNLLEMIDAMMGARFTQPWGRGRLGGWKSLLTELGLLINIVPPLAGVIWNRRKSFSKIQFVICCAIFALTLFHGFAGGTRNVFVTFLATFLVGYLLTLPKNTILNTLVPIGLTVLIIGYGSYHMLEFRTIGLRNYIENKVYASESTRDTLAVDYNLASIGWIAAAMPKNHDYLGAEILVWSLVRPVPRVLWPGKPEGLSVSIEEIAGADGWTVAATYLGEAYMMAGILGVIAVSVGFGALAAWWNRMAMAHQSDYALIVYSLGFFAGGVTMRSMFWLTTTMLPVLALIALRKVGPFR